MTASPCVTCTDTARRCPCPPYCSWLDATTPPGQPDPQACHTCAESEWLLLAGEHPEQVAARLGTTPTALHRHLYRHNRHDLTRRTA